MATTRLITESEFRSSRYGDLADQIDGRLSDVIAQAEDYIEARLNRKFTKQSYTEILPATGTKLFMRNRPIVSVEQVQRGYFGSFNETIDLAYFRINGSQTAIELIGTYAYCPEQWKGFEYRVSYTAGYATVPYNVKAAVILQTALLAHTDFKLYGGDDGKKPSITYINDDIDRLLKPMCLPKYR